MKATHQIITQSDPAKQIYGIPLEPGSIKTSQKQDENPGLGPGQAAKPMSYHVISCHIHSHGVIPIDSP